MAMSTTANTTNPTEGVQFLSYPVGASTVIYNGRLVAVDASGNAWQANNSSGFVLAGIAIQTINNSGGGLYIQVQPPSDVLNTRFMTFDATSPAASWVGGLVYLIDDHTVQTASTSLAAGLCVSVENTSATGKVVVDLLRRTAA